MAVQWIGGDSTVESDEDSTSPAQFGEGTLWFGRHTADGDLLVFDPTREDPTANNLRFFSLGRFRVRAFPRGVVDSMIEEISDEVLLAEARARYEQRDSLEADYRRGQAEERARTDEQLHAELLRRHQEYLAGQGFPYEGVEATEIGAMKQRRSKCPACAIPLDNYAATRCLRCQGVLCSCGACSCVRPVKTAE
jgi:hypothetical protein